MAQLCLWIYITIIQILFPEVRPIISADFLTLLSATSLKDVAQKLEYCNN